MSTPTPTDPREDQPYVPLSKVLSKEFKDGLVRTEPAASGGDPISIEGSFVDSHTEQAESTTSKLAAEIAELREERRLQDLQISTLETELAAKDEAEKKVAYVIDALKQWNDDRLKRVDEAEVEATKWKAENDMYGWNYHQGIAAGLNFADIMMPKGLSDLLRAALTPAPTQEPPAGNKTDKKLEFIEKWHDPEWLKAYGGPAGGVTISNDSSTEGSAEHVANRCGVTMPERGSSGNQAPPAVTISTEKKGGDEPCAQKPQSQTLTESSESNPSESLKSSEASTPSTTTCASNSPADVRPEGRGELLPFNLSDALAGKPVVTTEGSVAQPCRCDGCGQLVTKLTQCEDDVFCDDCMRADDVYSETRGDF